MENSENAVNTVLSWKPWEILTNLAIADLYLYVAYLLIVNPQERSLTNWLLLLIALAVAVQIHQNINIQQGLLNK